MNVSLPEQPYTSAFASTADIKQAAEAIYDKCAWNKNSSKGGIASRIGMSLVTNEPAMTIRQG